ncbi:hypothetical protein [Neobacillus sp. OS1-33]|uniref:hypothetical protein n=1 Tax=Neobacillus sp. OS1-33 TaxID=3070683 RepID=UPI0027E214C2|nr:hypothetical protein [Neobacillus sp. OS1-33]WML27048.1 hypothetical protein RCG22_05300 [Neobacillus sp. OS1-33]
MLCLKGIYFINDRICINGLTKQESLTFQEQSLKKFINDQNIQVVKFNPYQLNDFYTIPHALLYDLKKEKVQIDCFMYYSSQVMEDFIYSYPAKWLILKSFFKELIAVEKQNDLNISEVV